MDKRIDLLFARFAAIYGHLWRSQFKDEDYFLPFAKKEWQTALVDFSDVVIEEAFTKCRDGYELAPTLPQFLQCCRQMEQQKDFYVVTPSVPANKEVVAACLQQCREFLSR